MKCSRFIMALILCLSVVSCGRTVKETGFEIQVLTDMVYPVPYEAYSQNPNFPDGVTMQSPIIGTVARGSLLIAQNDDNPVPYTPEVLARGKEVYQNYCQVCHGAQGDGDGPMVPKFPNPPAYSSQRVMGLTPMQVYNAISYGKGLMPGHTGQIDVPDRWKVVYYVEMLQGKRK